MEMLKVENLHKSFGANHVLRGVNFSLEKGEVLAIIGSSGGGKTTLLRCLNFLERADEGTIKVNGNPVYQATAGEKPVMASNAQLSFGLVFQQFNLFPQYSVLENLMLAPKLHDRKKPIAEREGNDSIRRRAEETLAMVGLSEKADAYPWVLSGGQQQRVAIARALMLHPDILCFDEPTSALDPELTGEVLRVIKSLKSSDRTMVIVTHEMEFARNVADKVIFMASGNIEEMGTPEEVFGNPQSERTKLFLSHAMGDRE